MSKAVSTAVENKKKSSVPKYSKTGNELPKHINSENDRRDRAQEQMSISDDEKEYGLGCNNCYACVSGGRYQCEFEIE